MLRVGIRIIATACSYTLPLLADIHVATTCSYTLPLLADIRVATTRWLKRCLFRAHLKALIVAEVLTYGGSEFQTDMPQLEKAQSPSVPYL